MELVDIPFTSAVPNTLWVTDIILELINKLPSRLFDELRPWGSIITQYPFIHKFTIGKAMETIYKARNQRTVLDEPLFPTDCRYSEDNLKQFFKRKPIRIIIAGDTNSSFYEISKLLAKDFQTYTISAKELINNEIIQKTKSGKWLENTLKTDKAVPIWVVMNLLELELDKEKYATKGFILTGFPITSILTTASRKYVECHDLKSQSMFAEEMEDESLKNCVQRQLDFIYNLGCRPDFIIYLDTHRYTKQFDESIEVFQKFILLYFRENVIRIDCRIGIDAILSSIKNRFKYINFKVNYECFVMNESQRETMSIEELCDSEKILPSYKWIISKFGQICPVDLYRGRLRFCGNKFPIRYLRNIFLFSSEENRTQFIQNPGKYMNLEPKCRVAVIGPHRSGKTTLSQYLARFLQAEIYTNHIQKSKTFYRFFDLTGELEDLDKQLLQENEHFKQNKIEEWTICVLGVLGEILSEALNEKDKRSRSNVFSSKNAFKFFHSLQKRNNSNGCTKAFLLEHFTFQGSFEYITSNDFLSWLESKSGPPHKQYVIDSAPLNLDFWKDLLIKDELPDCVFFLKVSSIKKLFDTYDFKHNQNCVNAKYICDRMRSKFEDFENIKEAYCEVSHPISNINGEFSKTDIKSLIEQRYSMTMKFIEEYREVQNFLQANNVKCIDIDISNQTWTQSLINALTEYLSLYQPKAIAGYDFFNTESEECLGSILSSMDVFLNDEATESDCATYDNNYGHCLDWCPICLNNQNILRKGNSLYSAEYKNQMYAMHSRDHLFEFIRNPALYSRTKCGVPPPRIFILGVSHRNKTNFAENLASTLNVRSNAYKQQPTVLPGCEIMETYSVQQFKKSYNKTKQQFLKNLAGDYKKGIVLVGFPFLWEQFKDLIQKNLYPECVVMLEDEEEITQTFYRYFARLDMMQALNMRYFSKMSL